MAKKKDPKPPKPGKGKRGAGGPRKSKLPKPVQSRAFALFGLIALLPIAWMLLQGQLELEAAARRAVLVLVGLMLLERVIAPVVMAVLNSGSKPDDPAEETRSDQPTKDSAPATQ